MDKITIDGIILTPLKNILHLSGNVLHAVKKSDVGFHGFGEAYFSIIAFDAIKAWKKHKQMTLNLIVPVGKIKFVMYDDRQNSMTKGNFYEVILSLGNYQRLTIPSNIWMGFKGLGRDVNMLLNIADFEHDPSEAEMLEIDKIDYRW